jgi:hypothetical protein
MIKVGLTFGQLPNLRFNWTNCFALVCQLEQGYSFTSWLESYRIMKVADLQKIGIFIFPSAMITSSRSGITLCHLGPFGSLLTILQMDYWIAHVSLVLGRVDGPNSIRYVDACITLLDPNLLSSRHASTLRSSLAIHGRIPWKHGFDTLLFHGSPLHFLDTYCLYRPVGGFALVSHQLLSHGRHWVEIRRTICWEQGHGFHERLNFFDRLLA